MLGIILINYLSDQLTIEFVLKWLNRIELNNVIVIVNNSSTKASNEFLANRLNGIIVNEYSNNIKYSNNKIFILSSPDNLGFAKGNNLGAQFLKKNFDCSYFLFTNNDILLPQSDVCTNLIDKLKRNDKIGMIGPKIIGLNGEYQSPEPYKSFLNRYCWMYLSTPFISAKMKRQVFKLDYAQNAKEGYHYRIMGSFFMMRSKDFFDCGMMDPHTFLYAEEVILSERLKVIKKGVYYYPLNYVIHAHGLTTKQKLGKQGINKFLLESEMYYYKTYMHTPVWKLFLGKCIYKLINRIK